MIPAIKSEFRKLLTVRSTYVISLLVAVLVTVVSIWPQGINLKGSQLQDPSQLSSDITGIVTVVGIFAGIVSILLMSHEYRYNTIMYTLTATNNRLKVLAAKFAVVSIYGIVFAVLMSTLAVLCAILGVHLAGNTLGAQSINYGAVIWHVLFFGWGMATTGLVLAVLIRNQIGAIVTMLVVPLVLENFLGVILGNNVAYLPFHALFSVVQPSNQLSPGQSAVVFLCYLILGWLTSLLLFLHRDAN